jgi:predicted N-formylglutamate amidohydrolase
MKKTLLVLTCEHASQHIPQTFQAQLPDLQTVHPFELYDPYAEQLTLSIANTLKCDYQLGHISRYVIDLNKNHQQDHCFSSWSLNHLNSEQRLSLLNDEYFQYRQTCHRMIQTHIDKGFQVMHVSVHTFNPKEKGVTHNAAIGILYDPTRHGEKEVARIWNELFLKRTDFRVRLNYPRSGRFDNITSHMRKQFEQSDYIGLELECNSSLLEKPASYDDFCEQLIHSIYSLIEML